VLSGLSLEIRNQINILLFSAEIVWLTNKKKKFSDNVHVRL